MILLITGIGDLCIKRAFSHDCFCVDGFSILKNCGKTENFFRLLRQWQIRCCFKHKMEGSFDDPNSGLLFENRPALYFCNYKENKKNNIRMLDTLFIEDFIDSMEEYFHFYNHNWQ